MRNPKILLPLLGMACILLACTLTDQIGDDQSDVIATSVAETLDSLGLDHPPLLLKNRSLNH